MELNKHRHQFEEKENYLICSCGKKVLKLEQIEGKENLRTGTKSDGKRYKVRKDRKRYFFPDEWEKFINQFKNKRHRFFFITLLNTGARIMEALNLKHKDIDSERLTISFKVVKQRKAKRNFYASGRSRTFFVSENFIKEYKSFIRNRTINPEDYLFLDNEKIPKNYEELDNKEKKKYYSPKVTAYSNLLSRKMKSSGIADWYNFSPHNIRKTYGMWIRVYRIEVAEICYRMGHDMDTYLAHYGSSLIFTDTEIRKIYSIMGDLK